MTVQDEPDNPNDRARAAADRLLTLVQDSLLQDAIRYWRGKIHPDGRLPGRNDLDPTDIPRLLPHLYLIDVRREPLRFRYRLIGTQVALWAGRDMTGATLDEVDYGANWDTIVGEYREVVESGLPRHEDLAARWPNKDYKFYTRLLFPLASDGRIVDMLLGALNIHKSEQRRR